MNIEEAKIEIPNTEVILIVIKLVDVVRLDDGGWLLRGSGS